MPDAAWAVSGTPQARPGGMTTPQFWHRLHAFRHVISGSLALASLNLTRWDCSQRQLQRSPPSLLTTAACSGLRSTPDCRPRRALLHLSYSYASPYGPAILVTHGHQRHFRRASATSAFTQLRTYRCVAARYLGDLLGGGRPPQQLRQLGEVRQPPRLVALQPSRLKVAISG